MDDIIKIGLNEECIIFCRYLINQAPNSYVLKKYQEGHKAGPALNEVSADQFDGLLIRIAKMNPFFTKLVDTFTSIFCRFSLFRKKLVLLLAILESCNPTHQHLDSADMSIRPVLLIKMIYKGLLFIFTLLLSIIIILPLRIMPSTHAKQSNG